MNFKSSCTISPESEPVTSWVQSTEQTPSISEDDAPISLNPTDHNFSFSLWAMAVKQQMLAVVQKHSDE